MASEPLVQVCEVAFEVARRGWEANPPVEPPAPMRSFIYLPQLPRRAMTVAQRVMHEDAAFRARVAAATTEARVGRAGHLWLTRPAGWETSYSALTGGSPTPPPLPTLGSVSAAGAPQHRAMRGPAPPPPAPRAPLGAVPFGAPAVAPSPPAPAPPSPVPAPPVPSGRESFESELANLRDLVDRLANERQNVSADRPASETTPTAVPVPVPARAVEVVPKAEFEEAIGDRDALAAELAELRASFAERDAQWDRLSHQVAALTEQRDAAVKETEQVVSQRDSVAADREAVVNDVASLQAERVRLLERLQDVDQGRSDLEAELADTSSRWQQLQGDFARVSEQKITVEAELDQLHRVRESAEAERRVLFGELAIQLGRVEAERDLLASQLEVANTRLRETREALHAATQRVGAELDSFDGALGEAQRGALAVDAAVSEASRQLDLLANVLGTAMAVGVSAVTDSSIDTDVDNAVDEDLAPTPDFDVERFEPANFESANFELANFETVGFESANFENVGYETGTFDSADLASADSTAMFADSMPFGEIASDETASSEPVLDQPVLDQPSTDLDDVLASYGLGAVELRSAEMASPPPPPPPPPFVAPLSDQPDASFPTLAPSSSSERARVAPISGDPLTVARHTVTTAEVVLLIDGDPVAAMGWPMLGPIERRDALVGNLGDLVGDTGAAVDVVFDGAVAGDELLPSAPAVRVRLTGSESGPADAISGLVDAYPLQWPVAVVTDDPTLAEIARARGAAILDNGQLLDLFMTP